MKKRQHILPCGRVIYYKETTPKDIGASDAIVNLLNKHRKELEKISPYNNAGRRRKVWSQKAYNQFCGILTKTLAESLINGDRIQTLDNHVWMIAGNTKPSKKHANWHTDGVQYGIVINGIKSNFGVRLSRKNRKELQARIMSGQNYHISHE